MVIADASASLRLLSHLFLISVLFDACINNLGEPVFDDVSVVILMTWYCFLLLQSFAPALASSCIAPPHFALTPNIHTACACQKTNLNRLSAFTCSLLQSASCDTFHHPRDLLLHGHAHRLDISRTIRSNFLPIPFFLHRVARAPCDYRCSARRLQAGRPCIPAR